jgi:hypothetical protein
MGGDPALTADSSLCAELVSRFRGNERMWGLFGIHSKAPFTIIEP